MKRMRSRQMMRIAKFLFGLFFCGLECVVASTDYIPFRYGLPEFGMKLIILNDRETSEADFQSALDRVVVAHINKYFMRTLPATQSNDVVSRQNFFTISVDSTLAQTPIELEEDNDDVKLLVIRAGFAGTALFSASTDSADGTSLTRDTIGDPMQMTSYITDALKEDGGFWELAEAFTHDDVLSRTGKMQIAVGSTIVGEGSLVGDDDDDDDDDDKISTIVLIIICVIAALFAFACVTCIFVLNGKRKDRALEQQKILRRERYKRYRKKVASLDKSSSSFDDSFNKSESTDNVTTGVPQGWHNKAKQPPKYSNARSRPTKKGIRSSDSHLHCITEESSENEGIEDDSSHRSEHGDNDIENVFGPIHSTNSSAFKAIDMYEQSSDWDENEPNVDNNAPLSSAGTNVDQTFDDEFDVPRDYEPAPPDIESDVFGIMNQDGFDTLSSGAFDFDMSSGTTAFEESSSLKLNESMRLGEFHDTQFTDVDYATSDDYEHRMMHPDLRFT